MLFKSSYFPQKGYSDNIRAVLQNILATIRVQVSNTTLKQFIQSHPDFPSLATIEDALQAWKIPHMVIQISADQLHEIPLPAIAHFSKQGGYFVMLQNIQGKQVRYLDPARGWQEESVSEFASQWTGITLILEAQQDSGEDNYAVNRRKEILNWLRIPILGTLLAILLVCVLIWSISHPSSLSTLGITLMISKLLGIALCVNLQKLERGSHSAFLQKVCQLTTQSNCEAVLQSQAAKIYGTIGMSDLGLFYFLGGILSLSLGLLTGQTPGLAFGLSVLSMLALPYTIFSIYYQGQILKQWCPLCLAVQAVLWAEFLTAYLFRGFDRGNFDYQVILLGGIGFAGALSILLMRSLPKDEDSEEKVFYLERTFSKFRRRVDIFLTLWKQEESFNPEGFEKEWIIGNPTAPLSLSAIFNLSCGACAKTYQEIEKLLNQFPDDLKVIVRLANPPESQRFDYPISKHLLALLVTQGSDQAWQMLRAWYEKPFLDLSFWQANFPVEVFDEDEVIALWQLHINWINQRNIHTTPALFLEHRKIPDYYTLEDLTYLIPGLRKEILTKTMDKLPNIIR
ncbi:MAG: cysteine peptidase family C39 domain-containing protein [Microscillaceae bacterium]|nr:cysteine peptidase family C39 domain-containing protein [Microscillaceae bacterium]